MSEENVELVRRFIETFNGGDLEGAIALVDPPPESEFMPGDIGPEPATVYRGPEGMSRASEMFWGEFDDPQIELHELIDAGEQVIVSATFRGRGKHSGAETSWGPLWGVFTMREGRMIRWQRFGTDRDEALEAAGLSE
jgi:ketosteroid isomerase-like protein